jgi:hypothetical protein
LLLTCIRAAESSSELAADAADAASDIAECTEQAEWTEQGDAQAAGSKA